MVRKEERGRGAGREDGSLGRRASSKLMGRGQKRGKKKNIVGKDSGHVAIAKMGLLSASLTLFAFYFRKHFPI